MTDGLLVIDKPTGPTSHQVVDVARRVLGVQRIGHTGTLDPLASGVLVLCVGRATRLVEYLTGHDKRYRGTVRLGVATNTFDAAGEIVAERPAEAERAAVERALASFRGIIRQRPPPFSALKRGGKRAYELARAGRPVDLPERDVRVYELELVEWRPPELTLEVHCSAGTYVRSLAHDLGMRLGCGGHLAALRRTSCGQFDLGGALSLEDIEAGAWRARMLPPEAGLSDWPVLHLTEREATLVVTGRPVPWPAASAAPASNGGKLRALRPDGTFLAIVAVDERMRLYRPVKVFS